MSNERVYFQFINKCFHCPHFCELGLDCTSPNKDNNFNLEEVDVYKEMHKDCPLLRIKDFVENCIQFIG